MTDGLFFLFKICIYSFDKASVISIDSFKITFSTMSPKWMFRKGVLLPLHLGIGQFPTIQAKATLAEVQKVMSTRPPLSLPC